MSDFNTDIDEEDFGVVRWWDDLELTGREKKDEKELAAWAARLSQLYDYCKTDVEAERSATDQLYPLSPDEQEVYYFDQIVNDRGVAVDIETTRQAIALIDRSSNEINKRIFKLTDGAVDTVGKVSKLTQWMASQGFVATSLDKNTLAEALRNTEIPPQVREALELRQLGSKTSVKKLFAILNMAEEDNRIRGQMLYHAASTGRFAGKGVQLQNLPRPDLPYPEQVIPYIKRGAMEEIELCFGPVQNAISDCIRSLIIAGPQKVFYAADFAAIEARVLAWIAGQDDLLVQFANDEDIYLAFASLIYNKPLNKKQHAFERQLGKACLSGETLVYTDRGLLPLQDITTDIRLWDGSKWVNHGGLIFQGIKETLTLCGVSLTPDHLVLCGTEWKESQYLAQDENSLSLALATAAENLLSPDLSGEYERGLLTSSFGATAPRNLNMPSPEIVFGISTALDAPPVLLKKAGLHANDIGDTQMFAPMMSIGSVCSTVYRLLSAAVQTLKTKALSTTALAELKSTPAGWQTEKNSLPTFLLSKIGMFQNTNSTAQIMTVGMSQGIYDLFHAKKMCKIEDKWKFYRTESENLKPVFDIVNAGPDNRFMIHTEAGPLIVHNCILGLGFQMGAAKFQLTCEKSGINLESQEEYERVVKLYRSQYKHISRFWYGIEKAAVTAVKNPDKVIKYKCFRLRMRDNNLRIQLPSGRVLNYPDARIIKNPTPWGEVREVVEISAVHPFNKKWVRAVVTPGTFTENVVQAIARDLMVAAMFRVEQSGYPVVLTVHDELVSEVDEGYGDVQEYELLVAATPGWAKGLPVKAEGWTGKRYRK